MLVQPLTGYKGTQMMDVAFPIRIRAPTEERIQQADEDGAQEQDVDRAQLNRQTRADDQAVTGGEEDGVTPMLGEAVPGQRVAGEDFIRGNRLSDEQRGNGDERRDNQIHPRDR